MRVWIVHLCCLDMRIKSSQVVLTHNLERSRLIVIIGALVLVVLCLPISFWRGSVYGHQQEQDVAEKLKLLEAEHAELLAQLESSRLQQAVHEHGNEVTRIAAESVRATNKELREQMLELEELVTFYRGVMEPDKNKRGLQVERFKLNRLADQRFRYKVILVQRVASRSFVDGQLYLNITGLKNGKAESFPLELDKKGGVSEKRKFRFRYFQAFNGEVSLPENFVPEHVIVTAKSRGKNAATITKKFTWTVEDN